MHSFHSVNEKVTGCGSFRSEGGSALIEFTLVFPIFIVLMLNAMNFGFYIYSWITVSNAVRVVVQYQSYNGVAVKFPGTPTYAQALALFNADTSSLPGTPPTLTICRKNTDGTITVLGGSGSCAWIASDVENTAFAIWGVSATYTFQQFLGSSPIGIYALPTAIQQQVVMRSMQ